MNTFYNGYETYYILEDKDIAEILTEKLGSEFSDYIMSRIDAIEAEKYYQECRANTEANNYEASCEIFQNTIIDAKTALDEIMDMNATKPKLRKDTIIQKIWQIRRDLNTVV
jgi:hypothetical protein